MKKKIFPVLNGILIAATAIGCFCYNAMGGLLLKGLASFGFVLIGAVNLIYAASTKSKSLRFAGWMMAGLLICMIADIALNLNFIVGALIFAVGHICYIVGYCVLAKFRAKDLIPIGVLFGAGLVILSGFDFGSSLMSGVCTFYALLLSGMTGKSIANLIRHRTGTNWILMVGSVLFFISDLMLVLGKFGGAPAFTDTICLFTYYPGQCLLAHSVYHCTNAAKRMQ